MVDADKLPTSVIMPDRKKADNNIQLLIKDAFDESSCVTPILFLISHSVNVLTELSEFHATNAKSGISIKLHNFSCGKISQQNILSAL